MAYGDEKRRCGEEEYEQETVLPIYKKNPAHLVLLLSSELRFSDHTIAQTAIPDLAPPRCKSKLAISIAF